tara:strand:- start:237 stop:551 length:315 start_codon:yes stop_codon:yes gene_type:complete
MEVLVYLLITLGLFFLGLSIGAIIENKRIRLINRLNDLEKTTQEILLPLASKITHVDARHLESPVASTWVDYEEADPDATLQIPKELLYEHRSRGQNGEGEETR